MMEERSTGVSHRNPGHVLRGHLGPLPTQVCLLSLLTGCSEDPVVHQVGEVAQPSVLRSGRRWSCSTQHFESPSGPDRWRFFLPDPSGAASGACSSCVRAVDGKAACGQCERALCRLCVRSCGGCGAVVCAVCALVE